MVALPRDAEVSGFDTDENNLLTLPGEATLMGVETVLVHDSESQINAPNTVEPGEEIELNPSTELEGDITHSVVVYNEETFLDEDQETNIRLDEDISRSLTTEDIVLEHSIAEVNGVGEMTNSGTIFGTSVSQRTIAGTVALADIIDQLSTETDVGINRESISPETTIDASGVVKSDAGASTEMTVQTYGNWSEGTYRIVHIAENGTVGVLQPVRKPSTFRRVAVEVAGAVGAAEVVMTMMMMMMTMVTTVMTATQMLPSLSGTVVLPCLYRTSDRTRRPGLASAGT